MRPGRAPPIPGTLAYNIGDMLDRLTGGSRSYGDYLPGMVSKVFPQLRGDLLGQE